MGDTGADKWGNVESFISLCNQKWAVSCLYIFIANIENEIPIKPLLKSQDWATTICTIDFNIQKLCVLLTEFI
jgi:hypothetical protein